MNRKYKVFIIQAIIKQYREAFYHKLWSRLARFGVDLTVLYSTPGRIDDSKRDNIELPPGMGKKVPRLYFLNDRILLQGMAVSDLLNSDLIIIGQMSGCLHNYPLLLLSRLGLKKVAFWGHGYNLQGNPKSFSESVKRGLVNWVNWWFAYTPGTARYLISAGVSPDRITSVDNAIDTKRFRELVKSVSIEETKNMKHHLGINEGDRVGIYCGSLYAEKMIPFLINTGLRIAEIDPRFRLLVVGGGSEADFVRRASDANRCLVYAGPLFGRDKAVCFSMSEVSLNPGAVGLGILDSFAAGLPYVTTCNARHCPEIDYLDSGVNGLMVSGDEVAFANAILELLSNPDRIAMMRKAAEETAARYTVENMVENMSNGILACLEIKE